MEHAIKVSMEKTELEGPYECPYCGGHFMIDATYLDQVDITINYPYCSHRHNNETIMEIP
jgi:uncharacterized Zn-finger protein